jgi:hypothetical protein
MEITKYDNTIIRVLYKKDVCLDLPNLLLIHLFFTLGLNITDSDISLNIFREVVKCKITQKALIYPLKAITNSLNIIGY